jgi:signal transduction histidine kinase
LNRYVELDQLFEMMAQKITGLMKVRFISIYMYNPDTDVYECFRTSLHPDTPQAAPVPAQSFRKDSALIGYFTKDMAVLDTEKRPETKIFLSPTRPIAESDQALAIPFFYHEEMVGFMIMGTKLSGLPFFNNDIELLTTIANQTAVVIRHINLFQEMEKVHHLMYEQDKMVSLGALAFGIAHEIKNPLTPIKTFTQVITRRPDMGAREKEMGERVLNEFDRLDALLSNLLTYGRSGDTQPAPTDLNGAIDEILMLFSDVFRKHAVKKNVAYQAGLPLIQANRSQLKQVFMNLISNAVDAMPSGGALTITTRDDREKNQVVASFTDTGQGIPEENYKKIFRALYTTKPNGTGLGLAICKNIVKEHNGNIWVTSKMSHGTTFNISFNKSNVSRAG